MTEGMTLHNSKSKAKRPEWATEAFTDAWSLLEVCRRQGTMGAILGPSGSGKTTTGKAYARECEEAVYLRLGVASNKLQPFLFTLAKQLGQYVTATQGSAALHEAVITGLWRRQSPLLILDEFNHATPELVHAIRDIWDEVTEELKEKCGIVLLGTPDMEELWDKGRKPGGDPFESFRERLTVCKVARPGPEEAALLCQDLGLEGKREQDLIAQYLAARRGLHSLSRLITTAKGLAGKGQAVTATQLFEAHKLVEAGL